MDPVIVPHKVCRYLAPISDVFASILELSDESDEFNTCYLPGHLSRRAFADLISYIMHDKSPDQFTCIEQYMTSQQEWDDLIDFLNVPISYPHSFSFQAALSNLPDLKRLVDTNVFRRQHIFNVRGWLDERPYEMLLPISSLQSSFDPLHNATFPLTRKCYAIMESFNTPRIIQPTLESLVSRINEFNDTLSWIVDTLGAVPWFNGRSGVVLAGGFLTAALYGLSRPNHCYPGTDIDVFLVVNHCDFCSPKAVQDEANRILHQLVSAIDDKGLVSTFKIARQCITIHTRNNLKLQVILVVYDSPSHVIHGFDIAVCKIVFDSKRGAWLTEDAVSAILNNELLFDETTMSKSGVYRYVKYMNRYGLSILIPGMSQQLFSYLYVMVFWNRSSSTIIEPGTILSLIHESIITVYGEHSTPPTTRLSDYDELELEDIQSIHRARIYHWLNAKRRPNFPIMSEDVTVFTGSFNPIKVDIYHDIHLYSFDTFVRFRRVLPQYLITNLLLIWSLCMMTVWSVPRWIEKVK